MKAGRFQMQIPVQRARNLWMRLLPTLMLVLVAAPSLAMMGFEPVAETEESIGSSIPEPRALLLFALGALLVVWTVRRRRATS